MNIITILLQAATSEGKPGPGWLTSLLPLLLIIVAFWLFFIRPQSKRAKEEKKFRDELKPGDKIVTIGGFHGKITKVKEFTVMVSLAPDCEVELEKTAIVKDAARVGQA